MISEDLKVYIVNCRSGKQNVGLALILGRYDSKRLKFESTSVIACKHRTSKKTLGSLYTKRLVNSLGINDHIDKTYYEW